MVLATYPGIYSRLLVTPAFRRPAIVQSTAGAAVSLEQQIASLEQQIALVAAAKADVETRLSKYTKALTMDRDSASRAIRSMNAWSNDFGPSVASLPPDAAIPEGERPRLPAQEAKDMVSALFFDGSYGFHFYTNGTIHREIAEGRWTEAEALEDLDGRMRAFKLLTAMDEDGGLSRIYGGSIAGLGVALTPWQIGAIVVLVAAVVGSLAYLYFDKRDAREKQWDALMKLCEAASKTGNKQALEQCAEAIKPPPQPADPIQTAVLVLGGVLALYVVGYFVLPKYVAAW